MAARAAARAPAAAAARDGRSACSAAPRRCATACARPGSSRPSAIGSLDDLGTLPFTEKADLREHYPFGLLAVPREQLVRIHASSGTGGKPTIVGYTAGDLDVWAEVMARCMAMAGVRPGMLVHNANGYGLFTGGLGFHHGAERLGATVLPVSAGQTKRQVMLLRDLQAQVLCATPSYAVTIAEALEDEGIGPDELSLEVGLFGAEPWSEPMRDAARAPARAARAQLLRAVGDHRARAWPRSARRATARTSTRTTSSSRCSTPTREPVARASRASS